MVSRTKSFFISVQVLTTSLVLKIKSSISRTRSLELQLPSLNIGRTSVPVLKNVDL